MSTDFLMAVLLLILTYSRESSGLSSADISIEQAPAFKTVLPGSTTTMDCVARCNDPFRCEITWYFKGYLMYQTEKRRFFLNGSLQIIDFSKYDEGEYVCKVVSRPFARWSRALVLDLAVIQKETQRTFEEQATVGDNVLLPCYVEGVPKPRVIWTKHPNHMLTERAVQTMSSESNSLHIHRVTMEDAGLYKCHALNMAGQVLAASFALNVSQKGKPKPIRQLSNIRVVDAMLDEPVTLECLWSFSESVWYRGVVKVVDYKRVGSNLFILAASFSDAGVYTCRNSEDFLLYVDIKLTVYASPLLLSRRQVQVNVRNGGEVGLISTYIGHPTPEVKWFKNGYLLKESKKRPKMRIFVKKPNFPAHQTELFVYNSTLSDLGIYQCVVFNRFGSFEATFFVNIFEPGKIGPPENVRARPVMDGEIEVSWDPPSDLEGEATYSVYYWSQYDPSEKWMETNKTGIILIRLQPYTNYSFYVRTHANGIISEPSKFVSQMTNEEDLPLSLPEVTLLAEDSSTVAVRWKELSSRAANGVIVSHKILLRSYEDFKIKTYLVDGSVYNVTLKDLKPETRYDVVVLSSNHVGFPNLEDFEFGEYDPWETVYLSAKGELYFPEDLKVEMINTSTVTITWEVSRMSEDVDLYGYVFQYRNHKQKTLRLFASYPATSITLNDLVPGHSYEVIVHSMSKLGPGTPTTLNINTLEQLKEVRSTIPSKDTVEHETEVPSADTPKSLAATKSKSTFLAIQKEDALETFSAPRLAEDDLNAALMAEALNDTTISISLSEAYQRFFETDTIRVCYGIYEAREAATCRQWLGRDDFTSNKIYVGGLRPMTKYYFGVRDEKKWLSEIITCSTELPIPTNVKYARTADNRLNITWSVPEMAKDDLYFIVSYTSDTCCLDSKWSNNFVEGSATFYVIENCTTDRAYMVEVISVLGDVVSAGSGILHVPARVDDDDDEGPQHKQLGLSPFEISVMITVIVAVVITVVVPVAGAVVWRRRTTHEPVSTSRIKKGPRASSRTSRLDLKLNGNVENRDNCETRID